MARPNKDEVHLRRLRDLYARLGCIPSYSLMAQELGFKAKNGAFKLTQRLIESGHLAKSAGGRVAPGPSFFTLDISDDEVRAGFGADHGTTGLVHAQAIDQLLASRPSKTVLVKVRGDSMSEAGILSGDVAVVETSRHASHGDIVIAEIDGDITVKELRLNGGRTSLMPHATGLKSRSPKATMNVIGVVRGIVRSYRPTAISGAKLSS